MTDTKRAASGEGTPHRRGGRAPRRKGSSFEREVVRLLQEHGLAGERVPLSGSVKGRFDHDVYCPIRGIDRRIECKRRKRSFTTITNMLAGNFALVVRDDNSPTLVVMRIGDWAEMARTPADISSFAADLQQAEQQRK
jgi:hypothetical protein